MHSAVVAFLRDHPAAALFAIVALGSALGAIKIKGVSLGTSGVLFVALVFGHCGIEVPPAITALGVVLFVYAVGLQAGPRFFKSFRRRGLAFSVMAIVPVAASALTVLILDRIFHFGAALTSGMYAGTLTTTPGLAAARDALKDPTVTVGYGVAYPIGLVLIILFVQLVPRLRGVDLAEEARKVEGQERGPRLLYTYLEVRNPQLAGMTLAEVGRAHRGATNISRVIQDGQTLPARSELTLRLGDRIRVVATEAEIEHLAILVGPRLDHIDEPPSTIASRTVVVSEDAVAGKTLRELALRERFGITVTRIFREDFEFSPTGGTTLELGDTIRAVGAQEDLERFVPMVGRNEERLQETRFLPLALGLLAGLLLGEVPLPIPGVDLRLGSAGGPLLVALVVGHFGRIGPLTFRVPAAARYLTRELGLILFLAGAGSSAGKGFVEVLQGQGLALLIAVPILKLVALISAFLSARIVLRLDMATAMGFLCGAMTSTPGLGVVTTAARSQSPALAYATVYPVALILVTLTAQGIALTLKAWGG